MLLQFTDNIALTALLLSRNPFDSIPYRPRRIARRSLLASDRHPGSKKTYNNAISVIRRAFEFGYRDHPELPNLAIGLRTIRLKRQDRPKIDPFNIQDAETLIAALHRD
jgi:integrase